MKITTIEIEAHEKRAHPSEMGHWDSRVAYTAEIQPGEDPDRAVEFLQFKARQQVAMECDTWVNDILTREAQERARNDLRWIVERLENRLPTDTDAEQFERHLSLLPGDEHPDWRAKLSAAQAEYLARVKSDLDKIVDKAGRKQLSPRAISDYQELTHRLPEDERQGYIDKISDAIAAFELGQAFGGIVTKPEETATQVESKSSGDGGEVPF